MAFEPRSPAICSATVASPDRPAAAATATLDGSEKTAAFTAIVGEERHAHAVVAKLTAAIAYPVCELCQYEIATAASMEGPWIDVYKMETRIPDDTRHGLVFPITREQWDAIIAAYGNE